jgi:hypothetical protein
MNKPETLQFVIFFNRKLQTNVNEDDGNLQDAIR